MSEEKGTSATDVKKNANRTAVPIPPTKQSEPTAPVKKGQNRLIYMGPTIIEDGTEGKPSFVLKSMSIFSNGLPDDLAKRIKEDGHLAKLFVAVKNIASAVRALRDRDSDLAGSAIHIAKTYSNNRIKKAR